MSGQQCGKGLAWLGGENKRRGYIKSCRPVPYSLLFQLSLADPVQLLPLILHIKESRRWTLK